VSCRRVGGDRSIDGTSVVESREGCGTPFWLRRGAVVLSGPVCAVCGAVAAENKGTRVLPSCLAFSLGPRQPAPLIRHGFQGSDSPSRFAFLLPQVSTLTAGAQVDGFS